jgi:hypothetical protein
MVDTKKSAVKTGESYAEMKPSKYKFVKPLKHTLVEGECVDLSDLFREIEP